MKLLNLVNLVKIVKLVKMSDNSETSEPSEKANRSRLAILRTCSGHRAMKRNRKELLLELIKGIRDAGSTADFRILFEV